MYYLSSIQFHLLKHVSCSLQVWRCKGHVKRDRLLVSEVELNSKISQCNKICLLVQLSQIELILFLKCQPSVKITRALKPYFLLSFFCFLAFIDSFPFVCRLFFLEVDHFYKTFLLNCFFLNCKVALQSTGSTQASLCLSRLHFSKKT